MSLLKAPLVGAFFWLTPLLTYMLTEAVWAFPAQTFQEAKVILREIYKEDPLTFYCGCRFNAQGSVDLQSCDFESRTYSRRTFRVEWEHIVPAYTFGRNLSCWQQKLCLDKRGKPQRGRECCRKLDARFNTMEADLHNLVPEIGELNEARSYFSYRLLPQIENQYGGCAIKIDPRHKLVEPPPNVRGPIARISLYFYEKHQIPLKESMRKQFMAWHKQYPVTDAERRRNKKIAIIQGDANPYIQ